MLSDVKTTLKHTSVYGIANILRKGLAFLMIPVYTRFLSPADYGLMELFDLFLEVTLLLFGVRLSESLVRYYHHYEAEADKNEVVSTALIFSVAVGIILGIFISFLSRPLAHQVLGSFQDFSYFRFLAICLPFYIIVMVPDYYLLARKASITYSTISIFNLFLSLSLNIYFLVFLGLGIWGLLYSLLITKIVNLSILLYLVLPKIRLSFSAKKLKDMLRFGLPLVPGAFGIFIIHFSDRFFIRRFCPVDDLGVYALGYKFGMLISFLLSQPFFGVWNTQRFEIAKRKDGREVIGRMFTYYFFIMMFGGLGISMFSKEAVTVMAEAGYHGASAVIPLITLSYICYGIANFSTTGIMVTYKTKFILVANLAAAVVNITLNYTLIPSFGVMGAGIATVLTFLFLALLTFGFAQRLYRIQFEYRRLAGLSCLTLGAFVLSRLIHLPILWSLIVKGLLFGSVLILLYVCGFFTAEEKQRAKEIILGMLSRFGLVKAIPSGQNSP